MSRTNSSQTSDSGSSDSPDVVDQTYVFVARFEDGRKKDRLQLCIAESKRQATLMLPTDWRQDSVMVDSLGTFSKFYDLAPKLNYDFKKDYEYPDLLVRTVGEPHLDQIIEVAQSEVGWDELPPRSILSDEQVSVTSEIEDRFEETDPLSDMERTHLTDKLVLFRERVRRLVRNDAVDYNRLMEDPLKKHGLAEEDRPVIEVFHAMEMERQSPKTDDGVVYCGLILTEDGMPKSSPDIRVEEGEQLDGYHELADHPGYDLVLRVDSELKKRKVQHRALNILNRWMHQSKDSNAAEHDWYLFDVQSGDLPKRAVYYARNKQHALSKLRVDGDIEMDVRDATCYGPSRDDGEVTDVGVPDDDVESHIGFDIAPEKIPDAVSAVVEPEQSL